MSPIINQTGNSGSNLSNNIVNSQDSTIETHQATQDNNSQSGARATLDCPNCQPLSLQLPLPQSSPTSTPTLTSPIPSSLPSASIALDLLAQTSFGSASSPDAMFRLGSTTIKYLQIVGPAGETDRLVVQPGQDIKRLQVKALDNPGNAGANPGTFVWRFSSLTPFPGYLRYPVGEGLAELTSQLVFGRVDVIVESVETGLTASLPVLVGGTL